MQGDDEVGQLVGRRSAGRRGLQGVVDQRAESLDVAVDRARRALVCGELHPGADRAEVGLVDELRAGEGEGERWRCSLRPAWRRRRLSGAGGRRGGSGRRGAALSLGLKGSAEQPPTWKRSEIGAAPARASESTCPPKDFSAQEVGLRVKLGRSARTATERRSSGHAVEDLRQRIGDDADLGGDGVEEDGAAADHRAEVKGPGNGGDDRHDR